MIIKQIDGQIECSGICTRCTYRLASMSVYERVVILQMAYVYPKYVGIYITKYFVYVPINFVAWQDDLYQFADLLN